MRDDRNTQGRDHDRGHRLMAEAYAWPLVSKLAFERALLSLGRGPTAELSQDTELLSDELVRRLQAVGRGTSIESIRAVRDYAWFDADVEVACRVPMHEYLFRVARDYIYPSGGSFVLKTDRDVPELTRRFRWLSLMLPQDLLIAAYCAGAALTPHTTRVSLASPQLQTILRRGVTETHVHMGGGYDYPLFWSGLMQSLADKLPELDKRAVNADFFGTVVRSQQLLYAAAIVRLILARFLFRRARGGESGPLSGEWLVREVAQLTSSLWEPSRARAIMLDACRLLLDPRREISASPWQLRFLYSRWIGLRSIARSLEQLCASDPLTDLTPGVAPRLVELHFATSAMRYLAECAHSGRDDELFGGLFWQYSRVRCRLFRFLTLDPGTAGLEWFAQAYDRIKDLRGRLGPLQAEATIELQSRELSLRAIELRTTPDKTRSEIVAMLRDVAALGRRTGGRVEVGLSFHFIKRSGDKHGYFADPGLFGARARYGRWVRDAMQRASAVASTLEAYPEMLLVLNSVDVAGREMSMPTWPTLFPLHALRAASERAATRLHRRRPDWAAKPLRLTCHAGEDFRRLVEGLRRMHEVLRHGPLRPGDRIGHGLALFTSPARWAERSQRVFQPIDARLDDLLWELRRYRAGDLAPSARRVLRVEAEAQRLGAEIYGDVALEELLGARAMRHDTVLLGRLDYPRMERPQDIGVGATPVGRLLLRYLVDRAAWLRGRRVIEIREDDSEVEMLERAQAWLKAELCKREITIESNPSSNQLIADLDCIDHHPALSVTGPNNGPPCSINSDDPLTFATCLHDEYAYVYAAMLRGGATMAETIERIEAIRAAGLRSRFTLKASTDLQALAELLGRRA